VIPYTLNASGQMIDEVGAPLCVKIVGPQLAIRFVAGEHVKRRCQINLSTFVPGDRLGTG
jgi:hypothetical protein